jgi:RIO kinase 3
VHNQRRVVKGMEVGTRVSAKDTRSTRNAVLDPATELIVFKLIQNGSLREMESAVVKAGKEASVFHGLLDFSEKTAPWLAHLDEAVAPGTSCAVKIFKTTLNEFSNRAAYFDGDHRFGKFNKSVSTRDAIGKVCFVFTCHPTY